jgi:penicillin amidase
MVISGWIHPTRNVRFPTKYARPAGWIFGSLLSLGLIAAGWIHHELRASLPQLDGTQSVAGLSAPVTVTRDARGVPTINGASRADVARALGFLHAQDRFFQMDLLRRRAAGELAELFGQVALPRDRAARIHRFRTLAQQVLAALSAADRDLLDHYASGVNSGLHALGAKPFEYLIIRGTPAPWKPEDSLLVIYAMTLDLQDPTNNYEQSLAALRDHLGTAGVAFFAPLFTPNDAALDGTTAPLAPPPGPEVLDLRKPAEMVSRIGHPNTSRLLTSENAERFAGSNSFALSGAHTASGSALLANDPHLNLGLPNIWYRAVLSWPSTGTREPRSTLVGASLPGLPFIVLGSNGSIAWGLTVAYADTNDLVAVDLSPASPLLYQVPGRDAFAEIEIHRDIVKVRGASDETVESHWTTWGPIVAHDFRQRPLAHHWVAYDPSATNLNFLRLEQCRTVAEAVAVAHDSGIPAHNFLVVDRAGDIAWTIAGKYPKRVGFDGRLPVAWTFGDRRWDGYVPSDEVPTMSTSAAALSGNHSRASSDVLKSGRLWTANNRLVGGSDLLQLGDGSYAAPFRAAQVRDRLAELENATPRDFLALQRDDRGLFLEPWHRRLLDVLSPTAIAHKKSRSTLRGLIEPWDGRARVDSVSYRLVRTFRSIVADLTLEPIFASCWESAPSFDWHRFNYEPALNALVDEKPAHLLNPQFASWDDLLLAAADQVIAVVEQEGDSLKTATWGARNRARINHPLGRVLPFGLGRFLNLPPDPLPGDIHMPLIQSPSFGASLRLVVSPGRENEGIFEMPGGQSGHPLSEFYTAGHSAWVNGEPSPLLPGKTLHTLHLTP